MVKWRMRSGSMKPCITYDPGPVNFVAMFRQPPKYEIEFLASLARNSIPHREETKPSPSAELFRMKDQVRQCTKVNLPLRPNGSDKKQNATMFKYPNGFHGFSCPHASLCLKPEQDYKTFKVQIKNNLRISGTLTTPKGSLEWKNDCIKRTAVERVFFDNKRVLLVV